MIDDIFEAEHGGDQQEAASWALEPGDSGLYRRILAVVEDMTANWFINRHARLLLSPSY